MGAQSDVDRHRKAIQDLHNKISKESTKVSNARQKATKAVQSAQRTNSTSMQANKFREAEREEKRANDAEAARAKLEGQVAAATKKLHDAEAKLAKERAAEQDRSMRQLKTSIQRSESQFRPTPPLTFGSPPWRAASRPDPASYDLFISHASEDKEEIARPLADALVQAGLRVWFDEFTLKVGDSLRRKIDEGLAQSTFGVVILSQHFFSKNWTQTELDGLTAKAAASDDPVILSIWHHISKEEVLQRSPTLAGLLALNTSVMTLDEIAAALVERVRT